LRSFPPRLTTEGRIPRLPLLPRGMQETRSQKFTGEDDVRLHIMRTMSLTTIVLDTVVAFGQLEKQILFEPLFAEYSSCIWKGTKVAHTLLSSYL